MKPYSQATNGTIIWLAPFYNRTGFGNDARTMVTALNRYGENIRIIPVNNVEEGIDDIDMKALKALENTEVKLPITYIVSHVASKSWLEIDLPEPNLKILATTVIAETKEPPAKMLDACRKFDQIWVTTENERQVFIQHGFQPEKVQLISWSHGWLDNPNIPPIKPEITDSEKPFRFLNISLFLPRRRWDALIEAYLNEFNNNKNVELYLKVTYPSWHPEPDKPRKDLFSLIEELKIKTGSNAKIIVDENLGKRSDLVNLVDSCNVYVSTDTSQTAPVTEALARQRLIVIPESFKFEGNEFFVEINCDKEGKIALTEEMLKYLPHHKDLFLSLIDVKEVQKALRKAYEIPADKRKMMAEEIYKKLPSPKVAIIHFFEIIQVGWSVKYPLKKSNEIIIPDTNNKNSLKDKNYNNEFNNEVKMVDSREMNKLALNDKLEHGFTNKEAFGKNSIHAHLKAANLKMKSYEELDAAQDKGFFNLNFVDKAVKVNNKKDIIPKPNNSINIVWEGSQFIYHSLALVNRELSMQLLKHGYNLSLIPFEQDQFEPERNSPYYKLKEIVNKSLDSVDIHVRHHWPINLNPPQSGKWVIIQPWEFGYLPKEWVKVFSSQVDEMWVPSNYVKKVYEDSGVPSQRVFVVPNGVNTNKFNPNVKPYPLQTKKTFKFLFVGGTIYRKGIDILLDVYSQIFNREDDVCLVVKDIGGYSFYKGMIAKDRIEELQQNDDAPEIEYIETFLEEEELSGLYTACDVLVHPYRGEGFGLPILEAMACGIPPIVTNGGACLDFCNYENSLLVKAKAIRYENKMIGDKELTDYLWLYEPDKNDLKKQMLFAVENRAKMLELGEAASKFAHNNFSWENSFEILQKRIVELINKPILRFKNSTNDSFARVEELQKYFKKAIEYIEAENYQLAYENLRSCELLPQFIEIDSELKEKITLLSSRLKKYLENK